MNPEIVDHLNQTQFGYVVLFDNTRSGSAVIFYLIAVNNEITDRLLPDNIPSQCDSPLDIGSGVNRHVSMCLLNFFPN